MKEILYDWGGANVWLFHAINDVRAGWLDQFMLLGSWLGSHTQFPFYIALLSFITLYVANKPVLDVSAYQARFKQWVAVIAVFSIAYVLDGILLGMLKPLLDFPRPPLALSLETVNIIGVPEYHHSLPSGHASFAMLVVASLWPLLKRNWRIAGGCFVLWVGISRVSLGAHFPADVVAGFLSSLAVVMLVYTVIQGFLKYQKKQA